MHKEIYRKNAWTPTTQVNLPSGSFLAVATPTLVSLRVLIRIFRRPSPSLLYGSSPREEWFVFSPFSRSVAKPRHNEQILPVPWPLVISRFHCNIKCIIAYYRVMAVSSQFNLLMIRCKCRAFSSLCQATFRSRRSVKAGALWAEECRPIFSCPPMLKILRQTSSIKSVRNEKGTGGEISGIVPGDVPVSYWLIFSSVPSNNPRSLCES